MADWTGPWDETTPLATWTEKRDAVAAIVATTTVTGKAVLDLEGWEAEARRLLSCDAPPPAVRDPGCDVDVRYIVQTVRTQTREHVFAQLVYALELARSDDAGADRIVGVNLALAEEHANSLRYYRDDMVSISILRAIERARHPDAPPTHVALHAGEMVPELLAADGSQDEHVTFHVREAVERAGAERIGHGTDVVREDPDGTLLARMAERGVLVEACLTSNDWLLDVRADRHPLKRYLDAGVPVALATDDAGVFGIDLTDELVRAVTLQGVGYPELERMARASVEHSFLPGASVDAEPACGEALAHEWLDDAALAEHAPACVAYLARSARARARWAFERDLAAFERTAAPAAP